MDNLGKKSGVTNESEYKTEERVSCVKHTLEYTDITVKENRKIQKAPNSKHSRNPGHNGKNEPKTNRYRRE